MNVTVWHWCISQHVLPYCDDWKMVCIQKHNNTSISGMWYNKVFRQWKNPSSIGSFSMMMVYSRCNISMKYTTHSIPQQNFCQSVLFSWDITDSPGGCCNRRPGNSTQILWNLEAHNLFVSSQNDLETCKEKMLLLPYYMQNCETIWQLKWMSRMK